VNKLIIVMFVGEEFQLDSYYLRPGTTGEEQSRARLPYLSKVSLFDGKCKHCIKALQGNL